MLQSSPVLVGAPATDRNIAIGFLANACMHGRDCLTGRLSLINIPVHLTDQSQVNIEVEENRATLAAVLFMMVATDIDGDSDGDDIVYKLETNDNSLVGAHKLLI